MSKAPSNPGTCSSWTSMMHFTQCHPPSLHPSSACKGCGKQTFIPGPPSPSSLRPIQQSGACQEAPFPIWLAWVGAHSLALALPGSSQSPRETTTRARLTFVLYLLPHLGHGYGRSSECTLRCPFTCAIVLYSLPHSPQRNRRSLTCTSWCFFSK